MIHSASKPADTLVFSLLWRGLLIATTCSILAGCHQQAVKTVPVRGKVTLNGGEWGRPGLIYFTPAQPADGYPRRGGMADFATDGTFVAETFEPRDGLIPGRYVVNLECWEVPPTMGGPPAKSFIPDRFKHGANSGFEVVVDPQHRGWLEVAFDVVSP